MILQFLSGQRTSPKTLLCLYYHWNDLYFHWSRINCEYYSIHCQNSLFSPLSVVSERPETNFSDPPRACLPGIPEASLRLWAIRSPVHAPVFNGVQRCFGTPLKVLDLGDFTIHLAKIHCFYLVPQQSKSSGQLWSSEKPFSLFKLSTDLLSLWGWFIFRGD